MHVWKLKMMLEDLNNFISTERGALIVAEKSKDQLANMMIHLGKHGNVGKGHEKDILLIYSEFKEYLTEGKYAVFKKRAKKKYVFKQEYNWLKNI